MRCLAAFISPTAVDRDSPRDPEEKGKNSECTCSDKDVPRKCFDCFAGCISLRSFSNSKTLSRWKILSADASAEQDDYNREIAAKEVEDMKSWMTSLQEVSCLKWGFVEMLRHLHI